MVTVAFHGFLGAPAMWSGVAGEVVAPWVPGHGPTPWCPPDTDFTAVVDHLAHELLPAEGATLVGYSLGARLALCMALRHPARVRAAVLVGGTPGLRTEDERSSRRRDDARLADDLLREGLAAFVDRWEALALFATQRALPEETQRRRRTQREGHTPAGLAWSLRTLGTGAMPSLWDALPECEVPLRWITGARDEKFTDIARAVRAVCPAATHEVIADAGHDVVLECGVGVLGIPDAPWDPPRDNVAGASGIRRA